MMDRSSKAILLFVVLVFIWPGCVGAFELAFHSEDIADEWYDVGDVSIDNTANDLNIEITADTGYMITEVAIHVVGDPADFDRVIDNKTGKPKASKFDYKKDYLKDFGERVPSHTEPIPLESLGIALGNPCYIIVSAELQWGFEDDSGIEIWEDIGESAYAQNGGNFDRDDKDKDYLWGYYVTYQLVEP